MTYASDITLAFCVQPQPILATRSHLHHALSSNRNAFISTTPLTTNISYSRRTRPITAVASNPAPKPSTPSYKLGLCLAGAATGGAYSAGVMDFLLQALFEWQKAKDANQPDVPMWNLDISEMAGTSAGGITATLAAASLNTNFTPLPNNYRLGDPAPQYNPNFTTWVKELDHSGLFDNSDLNPRKEGGEKVVRSILNANFMRNTATKVLAEYEHITHLPPFADDCAVCLTATNMRGVPYTLTEFTTEKDADDDFRMRRYVDWTSFYLSEHPSSVPPIITDRAAVLDARSDRTTPDWLHAVACSRATAAFPAGFPTVRVDTPTKFYDQRLPVKPDWPSDVKEVTPYSALDGGVLNNHPFGILEEHMQMRHHRQLERSATDTWGSIVMIDPFPGNPEDPHLTADDLPLLPAMGALFNSIKGQAMFKSDEIEGAVDEQNMRQYMIRPVRKVGKNQEFELATGTLNHFGGMIDEKLRLHDFQLGRRNCQIFLRDVLCIPRKDAMSNPIFSPFVEREGSETIPIIPLVGAATEECPLPEWPSYSDSEREKVQGVVLGEAEKRTDRILEIYFEQMGLIKPAFLDPIQHYKNKVARFIKDGMVKFLGSQIDKALTNAMKVYVKN